MSSAPHAAAPDVGATERERRPPWRRLADGAAPPSYSSPLSVRHIVGRFVVFSVLAGLLLLVLGLWLDRVSARNDAIRHAREHIKVLTTLAVQPLLTPPLLAGDPVALQEFDRRMAARLPVVGVRHAVLRDAEGRLVWADQMDGHPAVRALTPDERAILAGRRAPPRFVRRPDPDSSASGTGLWEEGLLEVQRRVSGPDGRPLLFQTYSPYDSVGTHVASVWWRFALTTVGVVLVMQAVQVPLLRRMTRQLRAAEEERDRSARRAVAASDEERRRIAGDLHDGVVQDLAGTSFLLSGSLSRVQRVPEPSGDSPGWAEARRETGHALERSVAAVQQAIGALRSLLVEIYPANLGRAGLRQTLAGIARPLENRGVVVDMMVPEDAGLPMYVRQVLFRVGQEALRNVIKHASATHVTVALEQRNDEAVLCITDDGVGFDLQRATVDDDGHIGLTVISDVVREAGATLDIATAPGRGTRVRVTVPLL